MPGSGGGHRGWGQRGLRLMRFCTRRLGAPQMGWNQNRNSKRIDPFWGSPSLTHKMGGWTKCTSCTSGLSQHRGSSIRTGAGFYPTTRRQDGPFLCQTLQRNCLHPKPLLGGSPKGKTPPETSGCQALPSTNMVLLRNKCIFHLASCKCHCC